jgi:hypothetical protein
MWCSVVIIVMFNTVKPLSIISERTTKNKCGRMIDVGKFFFSQVILGELYEKGHYRADFSFEL